MENCNIVIVINNIIGINMCEINIIIVIIIIIIDIVIVILFLLLVLWCKNYII